MDEPEIRSVVHWFRKGLRIHDNPAFLEACETARTGNLYLRPIFILDPLITKWLRVGPNRWRFLQQSLEDLHEQLQKIGSRLYVIRGTPTEVFTRIFQDWEIDLLTFEEDHEPYAEERDMNIKSIAVEFGVQIIIRDSHTIYNPEVIIARNLGKAPMTYQKFLSVAEACGNVPKPCETPTKLPPFTKPIKDILELENPLCYDPPGLNEFGLKNSDLKECLYHGGESEALRRLEYYMSQTDWVCNFEKPKTSPNSLEPSTTVLSPYLKFGCLSPRLFYHELKNVLNTRKHTKPPVSLLGQLMWREFYYVVAYYVDNFDQMEDNPLCCQIPWDKNNEYLEAWKHGRTGYPFIDAIMRQLKQEGWIHHLARHAVACFLTRGDLWISWEEGQKVFEEYLLDADWALNAGNWLWMSASAFFHQYYRVYSPVTFGKKTDKTGKYIKKYVPELSKYPTEYIYEPWKAPLGVQRTAGCVVGKDYPERIVVHEKVYKVNIEKMKKAYKANKKKKEEQKEGDIEEVEGDEDNDNGNYKKLTETSGNASFNSESVASTSRQNCRSTKSGRKGRKRIKGQSSITSFVKRSKN